MRLADGALRAGFRLNGFDTLGSTNDEALRRAAEGDRGRLWIVARQQTAGRGRQGRTWWSPRGNLFASLLLVDAVPQARAWQLGFVAGVALADAVACCLGGGALVAIKWPNDLLAGGAKLAGVLVEGTRLSGGSFATVVGFGVNCVSHPDGTPYPATHLAAHATAPITAETCFEALSARVPEALALWNGGAGFDAVRAAWLERAVPTGTRLSISARGERRSGTFHTLDREGRLVLDTIEGRITFDVGDVFPSLTPAAAG